MKLLVPLLFLQGRLSNIYIMIILKSQWVTLLSLILNSRTINAPTNDSVAATFGLTILVQQVRSDANKYDLQHMSIAVNNNLLLHTYVYAGVIRWCSLIFLDYLVITQHPLVITCRLLWALYPLMYLQLQKSQWQHIAI